MSCINLFLESKCTKEFEFGSAFLEIKQNQDKVDLELIGKVSMVNRSAVSVHQRNSLGEETESGSWFLWITLKSKWFVSRMCGFCKDAQLQVISVQSCFCIGFYLMNICLTHRTKVTYSSCPLRIISLILFRLILPSNPALAFRNFAQSSQGKMRC